MGVVNLFLCIVQIFALNSEIDIMRIFPMILHTVVKTVVKTMRLVNIFVMMLQGLMMV